MKKSALARGILTLPYPEIDPYTREMLEELLLYFESCCITAITRMRVIPKKERPDWYDKQLRYWKNARSAFHWAMKRNRRSMTNATATAQRRAEAANPYLQGGDNATTSETS